MTNKTIKFTFDEKIVGISKAGTRIKQVTEYVDVGNGYHVKVEITVPEICIRTHDFKLQIEEKHYGFLECRDVLNRLIREETLRK